MRSERPWPRQSSVATAKPRALSSRTISKYFSMNSMRPWKMHTVPLRCDGGGQRANLIEMPSRVFRTPTTAPSGTGLAGIETSFIEEYFRKFGVAPHRIAYRNHRQHSTRGASPADEPAGAAVPLNDGSASPYWRRVGHPAAQTPVRPNGRTYACRFEGGYAMRTFDLSPLYRSTVGFD